MSIKRFPAALAAVAAACCVFAAPAAAQNQQEGLVNVAVEDVTVQLPIAVAANVCDVNVAVLATVLDESSACEAQAGSDAQAGAGGGGRNASATAFDPIDLEAIAGLALLDNDPTTDRATPFPPA